MTVWPKLGDHPVRATCAAETPYACATLYRYFPNRDALLRGLTDVAGRPCG
jgi:hypothetical protein